MRYADVVRQHFVVKSVAGNEMLCICPWHGDTNPGHLYINSRNGLFVCFSCHKKGSLDRLGVDLPLQTTAGIRDRLRARAVPEKATQHFPEGWLKQFDVPHPYWVQERRLSQAVVDRFCLGYDPFSNRTTLPLRDVRGRILGVTYRRLDDGKPKYLHPKGFPIGKHLYGAWLLRNEKTVALVEGQVDAIRCWSERVPALSMMGSRLTRDQVKVLQHLGVSKVVLMMDNDNAGLTGTIGVYEALQGSGIRVVSGWYRDYWNVKDPDALKGDRLRKMFHSALPMTDWAQQTSHQ